MNSIEQRIEQMAKNLAVASIFSQHPQQDDDYDRVMQGDYPLGIFVLDGFFVCEDYLFDHADALLERLESEYDKLKGFAKEVLAVKQVWKLEYDWDGGTIYDVVICNEQEANEEFIYQINQILYEGNEVTSADLEAFEEAVGVSKHPFWETHSPFIYLSKINEVRHNE